MPTIAEYGSWSSPITAEAVTAAQVGLIQPRLDRGVAYWLEARPEEGGRAAMRRRPLDGEAAEVTQASFNVRTRVHEYGGGAYAVKDGVIVAVNFLDQRVHRLTPGRPPHALTPESDAKLRFADFEFDLARGRVIAVREHHGTSGEPINTVVALGLERAGGAGRVLAEGHSFFSSPRLSPDGRKLAWLAWDHPNMPWDGTRLYLAELDAEGRPGSVREVAGGDAESIVQPEWSPDGRLHYVSDRSGFWNLFRATEDGGKLVCPMSAEFAGPAWALGMRWYGFLGPDALLACFTEGSRWHLGRIHAGSGRLERVALPYTSLSGLAVEGGRALLCAGAPDRASAVIALDPAGGDHRVLASAGQVPVGPELIARPGAIEFPGTDGETTHAFYYPPTNPEFAAPRGRLPQLIVKSHGGPTGAASSELRLAMQFWTSRGFAVCDVDYGGSTGYGRAYRERLDGRWGEVDVLDCVSAAKFLSADGRADARHLIITGGSAGGFTTLAALTFHEVFKAGASHYGVSDLEALARDTHKFESRYLDRLVGPYPEAAEIYRARSPIRHVDRLSCPIIFFQGLEDRVVPPNQAETMVGALRTKGLPVAYLAFEGEQHGFRSAKTIQTVLRAELTFYGRIFGFPVSDPLPDLVIENL